MSEYIKIDAVNLAVLDVCDYYGEGLIITRINVPHQHRGKGYATALLKRICDKADIERFKLWLEIQPSDGLSYEQLESWYKRHGFREYKTGIYMRKPN